MMERQELKLAAVVLAAGAGTRFGSEPGGKLLADLNGRPVLNHVLAALRTTGIDETVVVLGAAATRIEAAIEWSGERRIINPHPGHGLASSLAVGLVALAQSDSIDGAFIVLGDQPDLRPGVMLALAEAAAAARPADRVYVVPRYADQPGPRNPVLLLRPAWTAAASLEGDSGLAQLIEANPDQVAEVKVEGAMPDVDTTADLERLNRRDP